MTSHIFESIADATYVPPLFLRNGHAQTIFPAIARRVRGVTYKQERIRTDDDDFLDLDWSTTDAPTQRLAILCHGLEGHSMRSYMRGMARAVNTDQWDALAWNYRGCSGEPNRRLRFYHNGATEDLLRVVSHALTRQTYRHIVLIGFSLGGNLVLNFLAWHKKLLPAEIKKAVVYSVPLHIASSAAALASSANRIYMKRFLKELGAKIQAKARLFPESIHTDGYNKIKDFKGFDDRYTAPLHGFTDAVDYWTTCSGATAIPDISVPTLIVNAQNDPFLPAECFPKDTVATNPLVHMLTPRHGGHCGFPTFSHSGRYWSEEIACQFLNTIA